jgi:hypothetical protein
LLAVVVLTVVVSLRGAFFIHTPPSTPSVCCYCCCCCYCCYSLSLAVPSLVQIPSSTSSTASPGVTIRLGHQFHLHDFARLKSLQQCLQYPI